MRNQSLKPSGNWSARVGLAYCAIACFLAMVNSSYAQTGGSEDISKRRAQLQQMQAQLRDDIKQRSQVLYSVSVAQSQEEATFRRQESQLISLRTQESEVQRLLIKAELAVIEAGIKVDVCPEGAPDKRVVQAELKIAEAQRRFLSDKSDAIHHSMDLCIDQLNSRTADLDSRRAEIEQLQAKEQRVTAELDRLAKTTAVTPNVRPTVATASQ